MAEPILQWDSYSREAIERSDDWFWALGIITCFAVIISVILGNILLALIIGLAGFSLFQYERHPVNNRTVVKITKAGVMLNNELFSYEKIRSFWVEERHEDKQPSLILHYSRILVPNIHIPIIGVDPEEVRKLLLKNGEEETHKITFTETIFEVFGF